MNKKELRSLKQRVNTIKGARKEAQRIVNEYRLLEPKLSVVTYFSEGIDGEMNADLEIVITDMESYIDTVSINSIELPTKFDDGFNLIETIREVNMTDRNNMIKELKEYNFNINIEAEYSIQ